MCTSSDTIRAGSAAARHQRTVCGLTEAAQRVLARHAWPGNVRELGGAEWIDEPDLFVSSAAAIQGPATLELLERAAVERALAEHDWNVSRAAQTLGVTRKALYRRMERFGLTR